MKATCKTSFICLILAIFLAACQPAAIPTLPPTSTPDAPVPPAPTPEPTAAIACAETFTRHELTVPYRKDAENPQPVYTYSSDEFKAALGDLDIASVCVPAEADAPYLIAAWDAADSSTTSGKMVLFGFNAWREAQLVYSTYDFQAGMEYDTYATRKDWDAMLISSQVGFERVYVSPNCYGRCTVFKTFVFPFPDHYVALILNLGSYEPGDVLDKQVAKFLGGEYPPELKPLSTRLDGMAGSLRFIPASME